MSRHKKHGRTPPRWEPLVQVAHYTDGAGREHRVADDEAMFGNALYTVRVSGSVGADGERYVHVNVHRRDRKPLLDWRHLQRIKNELLGDEHEAVQLFPAESRLVDTANEFHMFARADGAPFPFGMRAGRLVMGAEASAYAPGAEQRPLDDDVTDVMTVEEYDRMLAETVPEQHRAVAETRELTKEGP